MNTPGFLKRYMKGFAIVLGLATAFASTASADLIVERQCPGGMVCVQWAWFPQAHLYQCVEYVCVDRDPWQKDYSEYQHLPSE